MEKEGVGDSVDSFSYDGRRVKKWNVSCHNYGQRWAPGDVITCCIDLEAGTVSFYRNGVDMGVAFNKVRCGENAPGIAYFPAVSISYGEKCSLNFGSRPFQYPLEGYAPLQQQLSPSLVSQARYFIECFKRLLELDINKKIVSASTKVTDPI